MARDRGLPVYGETCPQYLFLSAEEHLAAPGFEGAKYVCSTPIRPRAEGHQDALWNCLITNDLQVVSTDHCPFCMEDHPPLGTQKQHGLDDFTEALNLAIGNFIDERTTRMLRKRGKIRVSASVERRS